MKWIIQNNLYNEEDDFKIVKETFDKFGIEYFETSISKGKLYPEPVLHDNNIMILGGYSLMRYAKDNNFVPGCYTDNMDMKTWLKNYKDNMLNYDSKILKISEVNEDRPFFMRPEKDSKEFSGKTFNNKEEFEQFRLDLLATSIVANKDTNVIVSSLKCVHREVRFFIIDGKIISSSVYKINGVPRTSPVINEDEIRFVNVMINMYQPDNAFVMDIGLTDDGLKIVELNCINCSGFYEADIQKIIMTLHTINNF